MALAVRYLPLVRAPTVTTGHNRLVSTDQTMPKKKLYQYVMTEDECQLFNILQRAQDRCTELLNDDPRLKQTLNLTISAGGQKSCTLNIDVAQMVQQCARVTAAYLVDFLDGDPSPSQTEPVHVSTDSHDRDSVFRTAGIIYESISQQNTGYPMLAKSLDAAVTTTSAIAYTSSSGSEYNAASRVARSKSASAVERDDKYGASSRSITEKRYVDATSVSATPTISQILEYANSIGLQLTVNAGKDVQKMYATLRENGEVRSFAGRTSTLAVYYAKLVALYMLMYKQGLHNLAYIVLLRFQNTTQTKVNSMPEIELAVKVFELLPPDSSLCRWFAILYSFVWGTQKNGEYSEFAAEHPSLDALALSKLLHAVAWYRDPFTEGHDAAVLSRWCDVHDHEKGSQEQQYCKRMRTGLKMNEERDACINEARMPKGAQSLTRSHCYKTTASKSPMSQVGSSHPTRKRREVEGSLASQGRRQTGSSSTRPYKKRK